MQGKSEKLSQKKGTLGDRTAKYNLGWYLGWVPGRDWDVRKKTRKSDCSLGFWLILIRFSSVT